MQESDIYFPCNWQFALYVGFPIAIMSYYGNPEWYNEWVYPLRDAFLQPEKADVVGAVDDVVLCTILIHTTCSETQ